MFILALACASPSSPVPSEAERLAARAARVTITRDTWGIAHVHGPTDADAVFGMVYAQAEDDFPRVEHNYLLALGRLAEAEGPSAIWSDLRARLYVDPADLRARPLSPEVRAVTEAWADGLNRYLLTHPDVPHTIERFEPWMALAFTEGSIGGDIERISLADLAAFYAGRPGTEGLVAPTAPTGSNGIAIAPSHTAGGRALLLINPHTSFFFRSELQMTSDEGLNVYGAATWGQPFVYQGFNARLGFMHTSSAVDSIDEFAEVVTGEATYRHGGEERPLVRRDVTLRVRTPAGLEERTLPTFHTHHGPVVRRLPDGRWVSVALAYAPERALTQDWAMNRASNLEEFRAALSHHTNASNNTLYADADGHVAYFHADFVPQRDPRFDYTAPVDGTDPAADWGPPRGLDENPIAVDPPSGWVYNTNNWPYSAAGPGTMRPADYPAYVDRGVENPRGVHAMALLGDRRDWTLDALRQAAYDPHLTAFDELLPPLFAAWDALPARSRRALADPIALLRAWDRRWGADSVETTLAITWAEALPAGAGAPERLAALQSAVDALTARAGDWRVPWGEVNRFQRLDRSIVPTFSADAPSVPVPYTAARWGSLAAFEARPDAAGQRYGRMGNSFVAVVEFGDRVRARAATAGGVSGDPSSPHFADQVDAVLSGELREVWFYPDELAGHVEREYHPGE